MAEREGVKGEEGQKGIQSGRYGRQHVGAGVKEATGMIEAFGVGSGALLSMLSTSRGKVNSKMTILVEPREQLVAFLPKAHKSQETHMTY